MSEGMTSRALGSYSAKRCPVVAQWDVLHPDARLPFPEAVQRRVDAGTVFEAELLGSVRPGPGSGWVVVADADQATMAEATMAALAEPATLVVDNGVLPSVDRRSGKPDLLVRHGAGWVPVDVKHHRTVDEVPNATVLVSDPTRPFPDDARELVGFALRKHDGDALQLAHYRRMLAGLGVGADSPLGGILGTDGVVTWYDLDEPMWQTPAKSDRKRATRTSMERYDFEFAFRLDIVDAAHRSTELVEPRWCGDCPSCAYREVCGPVLMAGSGDASLLPGLRYPDWRALRDAGVRTRADVAALHHPTAALVAEGVVVAEWLTDADGHPPGTPLPDVNGRRRKQLEVLAAVGITTVDDLAALDPTTAGFGGWAAKAILHARAATTPEPVHRWPGVAVPVLARADVEVDVDMENTEDGVYLWGCLLNDRTAGTTEYVPFVDWRPLTAEVERDIFERFWAWLTTLRAETTAAGRSFAAYVWYEPAEKTRLLRISRGLASEAAVADLVASDEWVDLRQVFTATWTTGGSTSLKAIAPLAGFDWDVDDPGGDLSMVKHAEAVGADPTAAVAARDWLLTYNHGDVEATQAIREWIATEGAGWPEVWAG